jgi:hypothetical protein
MDASEQAAENFLQKLGLRVERFSKDEMQRGKTPDFRAFKADELVLYCEAKHVQRDEWLDEALQKAQPGELVGGLRESDPIFNRLTSHTHQAVKQFDAVNPSQAYPNVLFFTNSDKACLYDDLISVLTGSFYSAGGAVDPIYKQYSEGRIKEEKSRIDLFVWWNDWITREPKPHFMNRSSHYLALCKLLNSDPASHRVL